MSLEPTVARTFCEWYADNVCRSISYRGVPIIKWIGDLWNYQQIIAKLRPSLIIEFGTSSGGSALWLADLLALVNPKGLVYSVDKLDEASVLVKGNPLIKLEICDSVAPGQRAMLLSLRQQFPGPAFAILDSDHEKPHVLAEMELLREVLETGDYLVVEDSCINGHPIYANWGEGPFEAIEEYEQRHPDDYEHDRENEARFGLTFATNGYLVRR